MKLKKKTVLVRHSKYPKDIHFLEFLHGKRNERYEQRLVVRVSPLDPSAQNEVQKKEERAMLRCDGNGIHVTVAGNKLAYLQYHEAYDLWLALNEYHQSYGKTTIKRI